MLLINRQSFLERERGRRSARSSTAHAHNLVGLHVCVCMSVCSISAALAPGAESYIRAHSATAAKTGVCARSHDRAGSSSLKLYYECGVMDMPLTLFFVKVTERAFFSKRLLVRIVVVGPRHVCCKYCDECYCKLWTFFFGLGTESN